MGPPFDVPTAGLAEAALPRRRSGSLGGERQSWEEGPVCWLSILRMRRALQGWEAGSGEDGRRGGLGSPSTRGLKVSTPRRPTVFIICTRCVHLNKTASFAASASGCTH